MNDYTSSPVTSVPQAPKVGKLVDTSLSYQELTKKRYMTASHVTAVILLVIELGAIAVVVLLFIGFFDKDPPNISALPILSHAHRTYGNDFLRKHKKDHVSGTKPCGSCQQRTAR